MTGLLADRSHCPVDCGGSSADRSRERVAFARREGCHAICLRILDVSADAIEIQMSCTASDITLMQEALRVSEK